MLRRLVSRRRGLVTRRTQDKNEIATVLQRNLKGRNRATDPLGENGHAWIAAQQMPIDERLTVDGSLRQMDFLADELARVDAISAQQVLGDEDVRWLKTIPGIDVVTAATLAAVIGDVRRSRPRTCSRGISSAICGCTRRSASRAPGRPATAAQSKEGPARRAPRTRQGLPFARSRLVRRKIRALALKPARRAPSRARGPIRSGRPSAMPP